MKKLKGVYTALITPFTNKGDIDYKSLKNLIKIQLQAKIDGIVILGTTAESPVVKKEEAEELIKFIVKQIKGKMKIVIGTGSNNTASTIEKSKQAQKLGAQALLVVNPYYNKPTQQGLYEHFKKVANSVDIDIILYNIAGRTGVNLQTDTLLKLAKIKNIIAVKEASGDINQITDVIKSAGKDFSVLSGDDSLTYPVMSLGGDGVVSVISNIFPKEMKKISQYMANDNHKEALKLHLKLLPIFRAVLSIGSNPIAVKTILAKNKLIEETFRLPLCSLSKEEKSELFKIYKQSN